MHLLILAGGLATRLKPLSFKLPKSLIDINGKPFIHYQLKYIQDQGIEKVTLCIGYKGEMIKNYVGNGNNWGLDVTYSSDWPNLLGTGGAIQKALPFVSEDFFVLYGDSFLPINYLEILSYYRKKRLNNLITIYKNKNLFDKSNIIFDGNKILLYDKVNLNKEMNYIDYGLSILNKTLFKDIKINQNFDLGELFKTLSYSNKLNGIEIKKRFYEIGSFKGIEDTSEFFNMKN